jgi:hypothetical protein
MKKSFLAAVAAAVMFAGSLGSALAAPISGTFTMNIYHTGTGSGSGSAADQQANVSNPLLTSTNLLATVIYTGAINFNAPQNNIASFLDSGGGSYTCSSCSSTTLSSGSFDDTTVFDIYGTTGVGLVGTIQHDDGITLYQNGIGVTASTSAAPTSLKTTNYALNAGDFRLIYVAANDLPEVLKMDVARTVPEPSSVLLASAALLGLGFSSRLGRRKAA